MAEDKKKESKSSKLYRDSPTARRDEDGKVKIMRPSDEETQEDIDTAKEPDGEGVEPQHIEAIKDMHDRHSAELHDMHKRHMKEMKKTYGKKESMEDGKEPESMKNVTKDKKD